MTRASALRLPVIAPLIFAAATLWLLPASAGPNPFLATIDPAAKRALNSIELKAPGPNGEYTIQLPSGEKLHFDGVSVSVNGGVRTIRATSGDNRLLLTTDHQNAFGYVTTDRGIYRIGVDDGLPVIADATSIVDPLQITKGWFDDAVTDKDQILEQLIARGVIPEPSPAAEAAATTVVDIAFYYQQEMADLWGLQYPRTASQSAVDFTNAAFAMHGLDLELRLVYVGTLATPLVGDPWSSFIGSQERWDTAIEYGADLQHYIYLYGGQPYCGVGYLPGRTAVSAIECGNETISHEIGHNFGMNHDRPNAGNVNQPYNEFNFGYYCGGYYTLMSYGSPEVPHYSSPLLMQNAEACGVEIGQPDAAYNAEVPPFTMATTAAYLPEQTIIGDVWIETAGPLDVDENTAGTITVTITRDGDTTQPASVEIGAVGIEATAGRDFAELAQRVEFAADETTVDVELQILDDENYEPAVETLEAVLRYPLGLAVTGDPLVVEITSEDPDRGIATFPSWYRYVDEGVGEIVIDVSRIGSTAEPLTVTFETVEDAALAGVDFVATSGEVSFGVGESASTLSVPIIDDDLFEGEVTRRFFVQLTGDNIDEDNDWFWVYVRNDDLYRGDLRFVSDSFVVMENASNVVIGVDRLNGLEGSHSFWIYTSDGTAVAYTDYPPYSYGRNMSNGVSHADTNVTIFDDNVVDGEKYFNIELDPTWGSLEPTTARVYIVDDEAPTPGGGVLSIGVDSVTVDEDAGVVELAVSRQGGDTGAALVGFSTTPGSATAGSDYVAVSGTLGWIDGDTTDKLISIPIIGDLNIETDETFDVTIDGAGGAVLGSTLSATVTIANDDATGTLSFDLAEYELAEAGWVDIVVNRSNGSSGAVSVSIQTVPASADENVDYGGLQTFLYWSNGDADPIPVRIYGYADQDAEFDEKFRVELSNPTGGAILGARSSTAVTIPANDLPEIPATLVVVADMNLNDAQELAVAGPGTTNVLVRDAVSGALLGDVDFGSDHAFGVVAMPDLDGDSTAELGVIGLRPSGQIRTLVKDAADGSTTVNLFYGDTYSVDGFALVPDFNGNGYPELAVLGAHRNNGRVRVMIRDTATNTGIKSIYLGNRMTPHDIVAIADVTGGGVPEIAVTGVIGATGQLLTQVRDADTAALHQNVFWSNGYEPLRTLSLPDIDGGGVDELVSLGIQQGTFAARLQIRDASTRAVITTAYLGSANIALDMTVVADINANGFPEIAVLFRNGLNAGLVRVYDSSTGNLLKNVFFNALQDPASIATLQDISGNGFEEIAVLGYDTGTRRVQIRDAQAGSLVNTIDFP